MYKQLSIFDYIESLKTVTTTLLSLGQLVYTVSRGEVREQKVEGLYRVKGRNEQYYHLTGSVTNDSEYGKSLFTDKREAEQKANEYLCCHKKILSSSIACIETHCFTYTRKVDGRKLYAWYGISYPIVGSEERFLMLKESMTYQHMIMFPSEKEARDFIKKKFMPEIEKNTMVECSLEPVVFRNLYPCRESSDWDWAEDGYTFIEDVEINQDISMNNEELEAS